MSAPDPRPDRQDHDQDHYATLGVHPDATPRQIAHAYRVLARALHPDTATAAAASTLDHTAIARGDTIARFTALTTAYTILHDPARRAAYDHTRTGDQAPPTMPTAPIAPPHPYIIDLTSPTPQHPETPRIPDAPRRANPPALRIGPTRVDPLP